ncbi:MAG: beta-ketoacyl-[acyl-carrier-protein] synthase family protein [Rhodospirillales bacterium]|nr:beta-ketoacyl-[acyl-carrier-protein] synthase family protein [Rhodospirillales bacterium]
MAITAFTTVNALGRGLQASLTALCSGTSGLRACDFPRAEIDTWIGRIEGLEHEAIKGSFAEYDCRNNRLVRLALLQDDFSVAVEAAVRRYGPERIGVLIGTSTSGIGETERAYAERDPLTGELPADFNYRCTQNVFSAADLSRRLLKLEGPALAISTACSSSAKAFASAARYIRAGMCDACVVGGVDSLCLTTLYGFRALELTSPQPCRPWDTGRDGLSLGEAAGFVLMERLGAGELGLAFLGYGESSDAYHMTAAHPEGRGAIRAMNEALARAGLRAEQVDYVNLHGTATPLNDRAEDRAVVAVFGTETPCSSTKGWTGHTLGAAGITEAIFSCLCLREGFIPASLNTRHVDSQLSAAIVRESRTQPVNIIVSNSFGFGGTNCSLVFGRVS